MTHKHHHKHPETGDPKPQQPAEAPAAPNNQEGPSSEELLDQLRRLQAEFDNYRKRMDTESASAQERGREKTVKELLPVMDAIELAIKHAGGPGGEKELLTGITLIHNQLRSLFENWGITEIPLDGAVDPRLHEVYLTETSKDAPSGSVLETLQKGYSRNGTILRTAKVKAARSE